VTQFVQVLIVSLVLASVYALIAVGFVLIYKGTRVVNFLQGILAYVGALLYFTLYDAFGHHFLPAFVVTIVAGVVIGGALYLLLIRPLVGQDVLIMVMLTLMLGTTVLTSIVNMIWPTSTVRIVDISLSRVAYHIHGVTVTPLQIAVVVVAVVVIGGLALVLRRAPIGIQMRASAENVVLAGYRRVNVNLTATVTWAIATVTAFLGGMGSGVNGFDVHLQDIGLFAFPALLIGGLDSIVGALVGSFILAFTQTAVATWYNPEYQDVSAYGLLLVIVMLRPYGFFGTPEYSRL
jgi:branched-chain amino acid transport system permease protein